MRQENRISVNALGLPEDVLENIPGGYHLCEYNPEAGNPFIYISPRFLEIVGWTREEIAERFDNQFSRMVHPDDFVNAHRYHAMDSSKDIRGGEYLGDEDEVYRILGKNGYLWVTGSANEIFLQGKKYIQGTISNITSFIKDSEVYRRKMEVAQQETQSNRIQLDQQQVINHAISKLFTCIYCMDMRDFSYVELSKAKDEICAVITDKGYAGDAFRNMCNYLVREEDVKDMQQFTELATLNQRLREKDWISQQFYGLTQGWSEGIFIVSERDAAGNCLQVIWCVRDIHKQKKKELDYRDEAQKATDIVASANMGLWVITLIDGKPPRMKASPKMLELLALPKDYTDEVGVYAAWYSRIIPEYRPAVHKLAEMMRRGERSEITYLWADPLQGEQYVRCGGVGKPLTDGGWLFQGYHYNVNNEVMKEKKRQRLLELRTKTVSEAIHGGFKISKNDPHFTFIMVSEQLAHLLGYDTPEELIKASGGSMSGLVNHEDMARELPGAMKSVAEGEMYTMRYRLLCKNGKWKNVEDRGRLIANENGEEEFWSFISDQDFLTEMAQANKAKTNFLFNMSHDIRTPMNAILGYSMLMKRKLKDPQLLDYQAKIEQSGNLLLSIINNVLDMSRIESGKMQLEERRAKISDIAQELMATFAPEAKKRRIAVAYHINLKHDNVLCDDTKIKEIFTNLVSNALKYTPAGGSVQAMIDEVPCEREDYARFRTQIVDTGIGMSPEFVPKLYDSFSRERNTTTSRVPGTGLGMAIVKRLVDAMKGTIEVESEPGKGTNFFVTLEYKLADASSSKENEQHSMCLARQEKLKGKHILLAEDNELNAEIAVAILEEMGFIVDHVTDGVECVQHVESHPAGTYDLVFMDIQMPNMDGYMATQLIRSMADTAKANIPILAMTANAFEEDKKEALRCGMNGHVAKPIELEKIEEALLAIFD